MLDDGPHSPAEWFRLRVADAWGAAAGAWGLPPAVARTHGYLLACREPMSEREVRDALGLSHRATAMALDRCVELGFAVRAEGRRVGARGPVGAAYQAVDDDWRWIAALVAERLRAGIDPLVAAVGDLARETAVARDGDPGDAAMAALAGWLGRFGGDVDLIAEVAARLGRLSPTEMRSLVAGTPQADGAADTWKPRAVDGVAPGPSPWPARDAPAVVVRAMPVVDPAASPPTSPAPTVAPAAPAVARPVTPAAPAPAASAPAASAPAASAPAAPKIVLHPVRPESEAPWHVAKARGNAPDRRDSKPKDRDKGGKADKADKGKDHRGRKKK